MEQVSRLTADEARKLAGRSIDEMVDNILIAIRQRAIEGQRLIRTGWDYKEDQDLWQQGGYHTTESWKLAKNILTNLGFDVSFYYEEKQFVDMYTLIKW